MEKKETKPPAPIKNKEAKPTEDDLLKRLIGSLAGNLTGKWGIVSVVLIVLALVVKLIFGEEGNYEEIIEKIYQILKGKE